MPSFATDSPCLTEPNGLAGRAPVGLTSRAGR